jgi:hypothetical protein
MSKSKAATKKEQETQSQQR